MEVVIGIIIGLVIGGVAVAGVWFYLKPQTDAIYEEANKDAADQREAANREAEAITTAARQEAQQLRLEAEKVTERRHQDLARSEERLERRNEKLEKQSKRLESREQMLNKRQSKMDRRQNQLEKFEEERQQQLEQIASMTSDEAKQALLDEVEKVARQDMARLMREIEDEARVTADVKARKLIALAIQRVASDQVAEMVVSVVPLPNEEMKGRIIGRNGRNIRAFEQAAGVDVVVDDTPEAVTISSFDPIRREVARRAMAKLITDGRIHPQRIEKLIKDAEKEVQQIVREAGEQAVYEANVHGLHPEIVKTLGRLKFRTSYGQNQLHHSVEAAKIASILAAELDANIEMAKMERCSTILVKQWIMTRKVPML